MKMYFVTAAALISIIIINTSCTHYYYAPSANNVPLFKQKKEARIQAQSSDGNEYSGFDIQTAYALSNHAAMQLNIFHASGNDGEYGSGSGLYVEAAGGYYMPSYNKHWIFETYAGLGLGGVKNKYGTYGDLEESKTSVTKFFIQPSYGFTSNHFDMALSSKFSLVTTGVNHSTLTKANNEFYYTQVNSLKGKSFFFWEPGVIIKAGFKNIKFITQVTYSVNSHTIQIVDNTNVSFGVVIPFIIK
jgi:hypothetical protein